MSREEMRRVLEAIGNLKHRTLLRTLHATGLRLSELLNLRVEDLDSQGMLIRVRQGKGKKDRYVPLSETLLEQLRRYWRDYRPGHWLFPSTDARRPPEGSSVQRVCARAALKARLSKRVSPHALRPAPVVFKIPCQKGQDPLIEEDRRPPEVSDGRCCLQQAAA